MPYDKNYPWIVIYEWIDYNHNELTRIERSHFKDWESANDYYQTKVPICKSNNLYCAMALIDQETPDELPF